MTKPTIRIIEEVRFSQKPGAQKGTMVAVKRLIYKRQ